MNRKQGNKIFTCFSLGFAVFVLICSSVSILRFAQPYAIEISRLRQVDSFLIPILVALSAIIIFVMIGITSLKKTKGEYAPFGFAVWGLSILLYAVITPDRVVKVLYAPPLQKFVEQSGLHIDVTTIQSVKTITEVLNLIVCSVVVVLGAAAALALIRRLTGREGSSLSFSLVISAALGLLASCTIMSTISKSWGYSFTFLILGCIAVTAGLFIWLALREKDAVARSSSF